MATHTTTEIKGEIKFDHLGLGKVLNRNSLRVPMNQREYKWEDKQVQALLHDFSKAITANRSSYFLGTIVLTPSENGTWKVADGQQRLATSTILLAAIRDYLYERKEEKGYSWIENTFLYEILPEENDTAPRLTLNLDDNAFFKARILARPDEPDRLIAHPDKPSHHLIESAAKKAAEHIEVVLKQQSDSNKVPHLYQWARFIENAAQVIILKVADDSDAFIMFETLNDRGLKTSQADLVKNYLLGETKDRIEEAQRKWAQMTTTLEQIEEDDITLSFLKHLLSSTYGLTTERDIFERIKTKIIGRGGAINFLDILAERANDYAAILNPEHPKWNGYSPNIRNYVNTMNDLQAVPLRHLMLPVATHFTPREAEKAFRLFISWAVRFLITGGGRGGRLEEAYADRAKEITDGKITTTKKLAEAMKEKIPSDRQFQDEFAVAQVQKAKLARYYLRALELKLKGDPEPEFVPNEGPAINLEHILPQNPGTGWGRVPPDVVRSYYPRLGNMVLLQATKNTSIGNKKFADKLPVLKNSAYVLTKEAGNATAWGTKEIDARQLKLAALAVKTWPIDVR
jgi:uncharacterized protein with ParB-like and HNH nuclease domain